MKQGMSAFSLRRLLGLLAEATSLSAALVVSGVLVAVGGVVFVVGSQGNPAAGRPASHNGVSNSIPKFSRNDLVGVALATGIGIGFACGDELGGRDRRPGGRTCCP